MNTELTDKELEELEALYQRRNDNNVAHKHFEIEAMSAFPTLITTIRTLTRAHEKAEEELARCDIRLMEAGIARSIGTEEGGTFRRNSLSERIDTLTRERDEAREEVVKLKACPICKGVGTYPTKIPRTGNETLVICPCRQVHNTPDRQLLDLYNTEVRQNRQAQESLRELLRKTEQELLDVSNSLKGQRELAATHRCKVCGALWICFKDSWSLASQQCGPCCDNQPMDAQIEGVGVYGDQDARYTKLLENANNDNDRLTAERDALKEENEFLKMHSAIPSHGCNYLTPAGTFCNKCGNIHSGTRLALALSTPSNQSPWRPIAEAPEVNGQYYFCRLAWGPDDDKSTSDGFRWNGRWFAAPTFYNGRAHNECQMKMRQIEVFPTHWQPLPQPPTEGGKEA